ncbi:MAG: hypothetical protein ABSA45_11075 [Verrucomicrobiota bacterium]|jgi:hypothetical protein
MKFAPFILGLTLLTLVNAPAQVSVEVVLDQEQFLPSESVPVAVRITNRSGQPLHLGADANWLTFNVESTEGFVVIKNSDVPVTGAFDLDSSQMATKRVDLAPYFVLSRPGRYKVIATVRIKEWNAEVPSPVKEFDIIDGAKLWSQDFGLPMPAGVTNRAPEVRRYSLIEANYLKSQLRLYAQVSNESETRVFKVTAVGPLVSFSQPEAKLDRLSNLHVLFQSGAQVFTYSVVNPNGSIIRREMYDYFNSRPRLSVNDDGDVVVVGGVRRLKPVELPQVKPPNELPPQTGAKP